MSSTIFDTYAAEFVSVLHQLGVKNNQQNDEPVTPVAMTLDDRDVLLEQCQDLLQQMSIEARSIDNMNEKKQCMERYMSYKNQYQTIKQQIERNALLTAASAASNSSTTPIQALQGNEDTVIQQNIKLQQSLQSIHNTEQIAIETMEQLSQQKETIHASQTKINTLQSMTQKANTITTNLLKPWWKKGY